MTTRSERAITTHSPEATAALAAALAQGLAGGEVLALYGDLGAGKTHFVKGLAQGLGVDPDEVTSPTFVLINEYDGRLHVYHFDAYRLGDPEELEALGCQEMFAGAGVCVVEWADRVESCLPEERLEVRIEHAGPRARALTFRPHGERYEALLAALPPSPAAS